MRQRDKRMSNLNFTPREMCETDCAAAAEIEKTVLDGWSVGGIEAAFSAPTGRLFVAEQEGEICAFAAFTALCEQANLDALSVKADCRDQGCARALLSFAFDVLEREDVQIFQLEAREKNAPALALYKSLGFVQNGLRHNFYENPTDDAVLMQREKTI